MATTPRFRSQYAGSSRNESQLTIAPSASRPFASVTTVESKQQSQIDDSASTTDSEDEMIGDEDEVKQYIKRSRHGQMTQNNMLKELKMENENFVEEEGGLPQYHMNSVDENPFGVKLIDMRLLARTNQLVKLTQNTKGQHVLTVHEDVGHFPMIGTVPRRLEPLVCWEHVPITGGVKHNQSIASSYQGGVVQLHRLPGTADRCMNSDDLSQDVGFDHAETPSAALTPPAQQKENPLLSFASLHLPSTQTAMQWSTAYNRMVLGGRNGVVSVWDVDEPTVSNMDRLHTQPITNCRTLNNFLYTSSLDSFDSVKAVDLDKSVVVYSLSDHVLNGVLTLNVDPEYIITTGCELKINLRPLSAPNATFTHLYDALVPHQGRITAVHRIPATPMLISGDNRGLIKFWDLRMGRCTQSFHASTFSHSQATSSTLIDYNKRSSNRATRLPMLKHSSAKGVSRGVKLSEGELAADDPSRVLSICPLPKLGLISISTASHRCTLSALNVAFPDLVDDDVPCRFILVPNPSEIITVHSNYFKLWCLTTGHLLYTSSPDLLSGDISACALVKPLQRQLLCGTTKGEVKCFTVSLGQCVINFTGRLREAISRVIDSTSEVRDEAMDEGTETKESEVDNGYAKKPVGDRKLSIVSLETMPKFRDQLVPYALVTLTNGIFVFPVTNQLRAVRPLKLHLVSSLLEEGRVQIIETYYRDRQLFLALSNNTVHILDIAYNNLLATYRLPSAELDNMIVAEIDPKQSLLYGTIASHVFSNSRPSSPPCLLSTILDPTFSSQKSMVQVVSGPRALLSHVLCVFFAADARGSVICGVGVPLSSAMSNTALHKNGNQQIIGMWDASSDSASIASSTWRSAQMLSRKETGKRRSTLTSFPKDGDAVLSQLPPPHQAPAVTHLHFFSEFECLVTGDELGHVKLWDVGGVIYSTQRGEGSGKVTSELPSQCFSAPLLMQHGHHPSTSSFEEVPPARSSYPPYLINSWHAHRDGFTCLEGIVHPTLQLPLILTAGPLHHLFLWSADGRLVGSLATGRKIDNISGGRRFGLLEYALGYSSTLNSLVEKWKEFLSYYHSYRRGGDESGSDASLSYRSEEDKHSGTKGKRDAFSSGGVRTAGSGCFMAPRDSEGQLEGLDATLRNDVRANMLRLIRPASPRSSAAGGDDDILETPRPRFFGPVVPRQGGVARRGSNPLYVTEPEQIKQSTLVFSTDAPNKPLSATVNPEAERRSSRLAHQPNSAAEPLVPKILSPSTEDRCEAFGEANPHFTEHSPVKFFPASSHKSENAAKSAGLQGQLPTLGSRDSELAKREESEKEPLHLFTPLWSAGGSKQTKKKTFRLARTGVAVKLGGNSAQSGGEERGHVSGPPKPSTKAASEDEEDGTADPSSGARRLKPIYAQALSLGEPRQKAVSVVQSNEGKEVSPRSITLVTGKTIAMPINRIKELLPPSHGDSNRKKRVRVY